MNERAKKTGTEKNFRPPFPGNGKIRLETVKNNSGKRGDTKGNSPKKAQN